MSNLVKQNNNLISSREIANDLGKLHQHILRDIRKQVDKGNPLFVDKNTASTFGVSEYIDSTGINNNTSII